MRSEASRSLPLHGSRLLIILNIPEKKEGCALKRRPFTQYPFSLFSSQAWARESYCLPALRLPKKKKISRKRRLGNRPRHLPRRSRREGIQVPHSTSGHGGLSAVLPGRSTHPVSTPPHSSAVTVGAGVLVRPSSAGVCETASRDQSRPGECRGNTRNRWPPGKAVVEILLFIVSVYWGEGGSLEDRVECWEWSGAAGDDLSFPVRISQRLHLRSARPRLPCAILGNPWLLEGQRPSPPSSSRRGTTRECPQEGRRPKEGEIVCHNSVRLVPRARAPRPVQPYIHRFFMPRL